MEISTRNKNEVVADCAEIEPTIEWKTKDYIFWWVHAYIRSKIWRTKANVFIKAPKTGWENLRSQGNICETSKNHWSIVTIKCGVKKSMIFLI